MTQQNKLIKFKCLLCRQIIEIRKGFERPNCPICSGVLIKFKEHEIETEREE